MGNSKNKWVQQWKNRVKRTKLPGVWLREKGGYLVRARVTDSTTRRQKEIRRVLPHHTEAEAFAWLVAEKERVRAGVVLAQQQKVHFGNYAASVFQRKIDLGELSTRASQERWKHTLEHLIGGIRDDDGRLVVHGFGEFLIDQVRSSHIEEWKVEVSRLVRSGRYKPTTTNGWFAVLRTVLKLAKRDFDLSGVATDGVKGFDETEHATYTEENPNALTVEQVTVFLSKLRDQYPQFYAFGYLGFVTGLRPSSIRPLRRQGASPDVDWDTGRLLVRRSHSRGKKTRNATKQGTRYAIMLPKDVIDVLRWHVESQFETEAQKESELLFPSVNGEFRAGSVLNKPFEAISVEMGLGFTFTARGMRRTYNDLMRAAQVQDLVVRSISGHASVRMQHHYSTVSSEEQRAGIAKVIQLVTARTPPGVETSEYHSGSETRAESGPGQGPGGTPTGTPDSASGTPKQRAS